MFLLVPAYPGCPGPKAVKQVCVCVCVCVRKDVGYERLVLIKGSFVYHMLNECYKQYTLKKIPDRL